MLNLTYSHVDTAQTLPRLVSCGAERNWAQTRGGWEQLRAAELGWPIPDRGGPDTEEFRGLLQQFEGAVRHCGAGGATGAAVRDRTSHSEGRHDRDKPCSPTVSSERALESGCGA